MLRNSGFLFLFEGDDGNFNIAFFILDLKRVFVF